MSGLYARTLRSLLMAGGAIALCTTSAQAQDQSTVGEIVVTATKIATPLSKVPLSVSAYSQESMDVKAIREIRDLAAQTPGLDFAQTTASVGGYRLSIRGIDSTAGAATTATYVDETAIQARNAALNYSGTTFPQIFDLERVEVLRGPQGTLFGASAQGGAVRFITPTPSLTDFGGYVRGMVSATVDGDPSYEFGAAIGGPIVADKLGFRISANRKHIGGWVDRVSWQIPEDKFENVNTDKSWIVRGSLLWQATEKLSITPSVYYQLREVDDTSFLWSTLSNLEHGRYVTGYAKAQPYRDRFVLPSLKAVYDGDAVTLTSVTAYYDRDVRETRDQSNTNYRTVLGANYLYPRMPGRREILTIMHPHTTQRDFTQEVRINNSDPDARLRWQAGVYYSHGVLKSDPKLTAPDFADVYLYATGRSMLTRYGSLPVNGIYTYMGDEKTQETSLAAFANVDFKITEQLTLTVGGRISKDKLEFNVLERGVDYGATGQQSAQGELKNSPFVPKVALSYQANDANLFYASYAEGYRTGGVNKSVPGTCAADLAVLGLSSPKTYEPDRTNSYEIGSKNRLFGGRLEMEASAYYIKWKNIQQQIRLPCQFSLVANTGQATSKGFDLNVNVEPTDGLILSAAVGYNDSEYTNTILVGTSPLVFEGQTLGATPWSANLAAEYHWAVGEHDAYVRAQYNVRAAEQNGFPYQNPIASVYDPTRVPSEKTKQLDLRAGMSVAQADISVFMENALNDAPALDFTPAYIRGPLQYGRTLRPRTVGVMVTSRF
ncbi:TonB-dependent receptor [Phenylobacterium sp.]|uniref:TonB-dependent receptor n=1 Tax=Phenylobacterium sp. TaxID=1871053 RepID=UPI003784F23D